MVYGTVEGGSSDDTIALNEVGCSEQIAPMNFVNEGHFEGPSNETPDWFGDFGESQRLWGALGVGSHNKLR